MNSFDFQLLYTSDETGVTVHHDLMNGDYVVHAGNFDAIRHDSYLSAVIAADNWEV